MPPKTKKEANEAFLHDMRRDAFGASYLTSYLAELSQKDQRGADDLLACVVTLFRTDDGLMVLKLMEKAVLHAAVPMGAGDSALREFNAVRNFVLEIRRLVANG